MTSPQTLHWLKAKEETSKLTDKFGMPIDAGILDTVTILRLMGIHTTMSCAGHPRRYTGGPYVLFSSPNAKLYENKCRAIEDHTSRLCKYYTRKATQAAVYERQKLHQHLADFYATRTANYNQRLLLAGSGIASSKLYCQGSDLAYIFKPKLRRDLLAANQAEMQAFADYLKTLFYKNEFQAQGTAS